MIALFRIIQGPSTGRRIQLRGGQCATVGKTDHADYRLPDDHGLQAIHFEIDCRGSGCRLIARPNAETLVNGQGVQECQLKNGDTIRVSQTVFAVTLEGMVEPQSENTSEGEDMDAEMLAAVMTMTELWDHLDLDADAKLIAERHEEVEPLIDELVKSELYYPALRLRADTLTNHHAVWWACASLHHLEPKLNLAPLDLAALSAAENWVKTPSEQTRRAAELAAEATGEGAAGMIAFAAFTSGGNIGHPDVQPVEPDERLCGTILAGALMMAGYCDPPNAHSVMSEMIANGKGPWKQPFALPL